MQTPPLDPDVADTAPSVRKSITHAARDLKILGRLAVVPGLTSGVTVLLVLGFTLLSITDSGPVVPWFGTAVGMVAAIAIGWVATRVRTGSIRTIQNELPALPISFERMPPADSTPVVSREASKIVSGNRDDAKTRTIALVRPKPRPKIPDSKPRPKTKPETKPETADSETVANIPPEDPVE